MSGINDITTLLKHMTPILNYGEYVFCTVNNIPDVSLENIIATFKEEEGVTLILKKEFADQLGVSYHYVASWITLTVHSSLAAVGLTAAFANALAAESISCNVVAAYYHDHIFVAVNDAERAMAVLRSLSA